MMRNYLTIVAGMSVLVCGVLTTTQQAVAVPLTGGTGPGGFIQTGGASDLTLWLRGDTGITKDGSNRVSQWDDQSGHANHVKQATTDNQPLQTATLNGVPIVGFDGGGQGANSDFLLTDGAVSAQSILIVNRATGSPTAPNPILGNSNTFLSIRRTNPNWNVPGDGNDFTFPVGSTFHVDGAVDTTSIVGTAQQLAAQRDAAFNFTRVQLARHNGFPDRAFQGDIGEVVIVNRALNNTERTIMENNLSAKFNLPLNTGSGAQDFYAGDGATEGDYDLDVVGIGNDGSNSVLNAGQSGFGIEVTDGSLGTNEWVFAGHESPTNSIVSFGLENARWERVWYVDPTSVDGISPSIAFDFSDADLGGPGAADWTLIYSASDDFAFSELASPSSVVGDLFTFDLSAAQLQAGYYTLGVIVPIPEPSSLALFGWGAALLAWRSRRRRANNSRA